MIPFASQRSHGQDLATHLLNAHDNENVEVMQVSGAIARDLHGAFEEWELMAQSLTKCQKYLYSLSINPDPAQGPLTRDQYLDYIARVEDRLGLTNQPRAIVFHEKQGREHCHVVWSRINAAEQKAVQLSHDKSKLMAITREFARDHALTLPEGYAPDKENQQSRAQKKLYELELERESGLSLDDHKERVTAAWRQSDGAKAFMQALAEEGYLLAKGKRGYLCVDFYGGHYALSRLIDDPGVKTKQVRDRLGRDLPLTHLPTLEEVQARLASHRKEVEAGSKDRALKDGLSELARQQAGRRCKLEEEKTALSYRQRALNRELESRHAYAREALKDSYRAQKREISLQRARNRPAGLAEFLGRISGVNHIRKKLHQYQDRQRLQDYRDKRRALRHEQKKESALLKLRLSLQDKDITRQEKALTQVEKREIAALKKEHKREARILERGQQNAMPDLSALAASLYEKLRGKAQGSGGKTKAPDLLGEFHKKAKDGSNEMPDLLGDFEKASRTRKRKSKGNEGEKSPVIQRPTSTKRPRRRRRDRGRNRDM